MTCHTDNIETRSRSLNITPYNIQGTKEKTRHTTMPIQSIVKRSTVVQSRNSETRYYMGRSPKRKAQAKGIQPKQAM